MEPPFAREILSGGPHPHFKETAKGRTCVVKRRCGKKSLSQCDT